MHVDLNSRQSQSFVLSVLGCVVAVLAFTLTVQPESLAEGAKADFSPVREFIKAEMVATSTPSMAVAVARGSELIWEEGFGYIDHPDGTAATPQTLYYSASVTKAFTATALMILHERKQLDLDRPANRYLMKAKLWSPHWNPEAATVRRIAMHTAGLATYDRGYVDGQTQERIPPDEIIRRYGIIFWRPGDHFDYSNLGYGILGEIVANVSGRSFHDFLRDEVFRPLAMKGTSVGIEAKPKQPVAAPYSALLRKFSPRSEPTMPGASAVYSTAHELALFGMFQLKARRPEQKPILSDAGIEALRDPTVDAGDNSRHSLAWWIKNDQYGYRTLLAQGGTYDSQAWLLLVPTEKITVALISNTGSAPASKSIDKILSILLPPYRGNMEAGANSTPPAAPAPTTISPPAPELVGTWSGELQTHRANLPLVLAIGPTGEMSGTLGRQTTARMTNVRFRDNRVTGRMPGDLGTADTDGVPYELRYELYRYGDKLIGAVTTYALPGRAGPRLSFWVELERQPDK